MKCKKCKTEFKPKKSYHRYCTSCIKIAVRCKTCNKMVLPKNGKYSCCGHEESVDHVKRANKSRSSGRSLGDILFEMEHGVSPERAAWNDGEYADYLNIPNRS